MKTYIINLDFSTLELRVLMEIYQIGLITNPGEKRIEAVKSLVDKGLLKYRKNQVITTKFARNAIKNNMFKKINQPPEFPEPKLEKFA